MSFGWAYVNCDEAPASDLEIYGPTGSVQFLKTGTCLTGSSQFIYYTASYGHYEPSTLVLTGTLVVSGTISASHYHIEDVTRIDASGSTYFGNTDDDMHVRTGSFIMTTSKPESYVSASALTQQTFVRSLALGYESVEMGMPEFSSSVSSSVIGVSGPNDIYIRIHSASIAGSGAIMVIKDELDTRTSTHSIYVSASWPNKIDGADYTQMVGGSMPSINLYSNGANWFIF